MFKHLALPTVAQRSSIFRPALLLLVLLSLLEISQAAIPDQKDQLMQFTADGHVLGFKSDGFYVVSGNHMLHVDFVGTEGVTPNVMDYDIVEADGKAKPLTQVAYMGLWPGINLHYEAIDGGVAMSTWEIAAGTDVNQIRMRYNSPVEITDDGSLKIRYETGWLHESAPVAWQEIEGKRKPVEVSFHILEASRNEPIIGFKTGPYDPAQPLLIDPTLTWNTFMGTTSADYGNAIALDVFGNVYVAGKSSLSWGKPVNSHAGNYEFDAFVAKLGINGELIWNTFMGSTDEDSGEAIAVDVWGNVYVAGNSFATWGTPVRGYSGDIDAFAAKLNVKGARLWHTFMGSTNFDLGKAIAVDFWGTRVHVAGTSGGTWGLPVRPYAGGSDAFTAGLVSGTGVLAGHTFLGSSSIDYGNAIALDGSLNVYVAGTSDQGWGTPVVNPHTGRRDAFVVKLNDVGVFQWNTFLGGAAVTGGDYGTDYGNAIALDSSGNIYVAGSSSSTWGTPVNAHAGGNPDAFAAKLDVNGNLLWNTFMGGKDEIDDGNAIKVDGGGNVYVAGNSHNTWGKPVNAHAGGNPDAFAAKLDASGKRLLHTFMGSASEDYGNAIAVDTTKNVHVVGTSMASWGTPINDHAGIYFDAFAAKLDAQLKLNPGAGGCFLYTPNDKMLMICW